MTVDIACTLSGPAMKERLATILALAERALIDQQQHGATLRLRYMIEVADELEAIVALERQCCAFLDFALSREAGFVQLVITAPAEAVDFTQTLMSHFAGSTETAGRCGTACSCEAASPR